MSPVKGAAHRAVARALMSTVLGGFGAACIQVPVPGMPEEATFDAGLGSYPEDFPSRGPYADPDPSIATDSPESRAARESTQDGGTDAATDPARDHGEPSAGESDRDQPARARQPRQPGELVITELMPDPAATPDAQGEWIELYNASEQSEFDLRGCSIADGGSREHVIMQPVVIAALAYATIARSDGAGFTPDLVLGVSLTNGGDSIALRCGDVEIDRVDYDVDFPLTPGASLSLDPSSRSAEQNDAASAWCPGHVALGADFGTPGVANPPCERTEPTRPQSASGNPGPRSSRNQDDASTPVKPASSGARPDAGSRPSASGSQPSRPDTSRQPRARGDLIITEIMADPAAMRDDEGEWLELYNTRDVGFDLQGCSLADGGASPRTIARSIAVGRGGYVTIARSDRAGFTPNLVLAVSLGNSADSIALQCSGTEIDRVDYDTAFPVESGSSMSLDPQAMDDAGNDDAGAWCPARTALGSDFGSPGRRNPPCDLSAALPPAAEAAIDPELAAPTEPDAAIDPEPAAPMEPVLTPASGLDTDAGTP